MYLLVFIDYSRCKEDNTLNVQISSPRRRRRCNPDVFCAHTCTAAFDLCLTLLPHFRHTLKSNRGFCSAAAQQRSLPIRSGGCAISVPFLLSQELDSVLMRIPASRPLLQRSSARAFRATAEAHHLLPMLALTLFMPSLIYQNI